MRRVFLATVLAALAVVAAGCGGSQTAKYPVSIYIANQHVGKVASGKAEAFFKKTLRISSGYMQVVVRVPNGVQLVDDALAAHKGRINLPYKPIGSFVSVRAQKQVFPHASEVTALSMILTRLGHDVAQVKLVPKLPGNGPLDRQPVAGSKLFRWGDPELGFVGRPDGAGDKGFGVYEGPIRKLAAPYDIHFDDLRGKSVDAVRKTLLEGHPVIAWVGGKSARPASWLTPSGKKITVDLGEHAVLIIGAGPDYFLLNDPLTGTQERWDTATFSPRFELIGRRALALR